MKKYQVIYADPAWKYDFSKSDNRKIENQYPTMSIEEIKNLPVKFITDKNAVCFMWATAPKLKEALSVLSEWGFEYVTHAIWDKCIIGMGYWFRGQHELLIVGRKGKFSPPPIEARVSSVLKEKRTKHSKKPHFVRDLIKSWYPEANRIELFARNSSNGWDLWGNEVNSTIEF